LLKILNKKKVIDYQFHFTRASKYLKNNILKKITGNKNI